MANEAEQVEGPYEAHDFTVNNLSGIAKYTLCALEDPRTAYPSVGTEVFAGIAGTEKVASDGSVELGLWTKGIFLLTNAPTAISMGTLVALSGANLIKAAVDADHIAGKVIGKALQDFAAAGEQGEVHVGVVV